MFHQVRVDCRKEFFLTLGMQEQFSHLHSNQDIYPYRQTQSKQVCLSWLIFYKGLYNTDYAYNGLFSFESFSLGYGTGRINK